MTASALSAKVLNTSLEVFIPPLKTKCSSLPLHYEGRLFFFLFYFFFLVFIQILDRNFCAFSYLCRLQGCLLVVSHLKLLLWKKYVHQCLKETNCYFKEWEYNSLEAFSSSFHIIIKAAIYNEPHHSFFHRKKKKTLKTTENKVCWNCLEYIPVIFQK